MDAYTEGDTTPPYTAVLLDGSDRYDATDAAEVRVKVWRNGALIKDVEADSVDADGTVKVTDVADLTTDPGPLYSKVIVTNDLGVQSFPAVGFLKTLVHPNIP